MYHSNPEQPKLNFGKNSHISSFIVGVVIHKIFDSCFFRVLSNFGTDNQMSVFIGGKKNTFSNYSDSRGIRHHFRTTCRPIITLSASSKHTIGRFDKNSNFLPSVDSGLPWTDPFKYFRSSFRTANVCLRGARYHWNMLAEAQIFRANEMPFLANTDILLAVRFAPVLKRKTTNSIIWKSKEASCNTVLLAHHSLCICNTTHSRDSLQMVKSLV